MPYNPAAYPYQLNTRELPSNQTAAAAYLALPYASTSGAWGGPTVSASVWAQSPSYTPNWSDETQTPGTVAAQSKSPSSVPSVDDPDSLVFARDVGAVQALNAEKARQTTAQTAATASITAINNITGGAPGVFSVTPNSTVHGVAAPVTIVGSGFTGATGVNIGGACTSVVVVNDGEITCSTPVASVAGTSNVAVTTPNGTGTGIGLMTYT